MTMTDVTKILTMIQIYWPHWKSLIGLKETAMAWYVVLSELQTDDVMSALNTYVRSGTPYAPGPGQLHHMVMEAQTSKLTAADVCTLVRKAARNARYGSETEFAQLPKQLQAVIGSPATIRTWADLSDEALRWEAKRLAEECAVTTTTTYTQIGTVNTCLLEGGENHDAV